MRSTVVSAALLFAFSSPSMAINLATLWDFSQPEVSEQRFRAALARATGDDVLILQTQIARTYGLRRDFETTRRLLREIESAIGGAGAEARVRYGLELGRSWASATHKRSELAVASKAKARAHFTQALALAREANLDALAIDAIHMFAFVDTDPADQLGWAREALRVAQSSSQPGAQRWEASIRNNMGIALQQLGRHEEALAEYGFAVALRERQNDVAATRVAKWMVASTLRRLNRIDEALDIQLRLERENDASGAPDIFVFEELEAIFTSKGDTARAEHYAMRRRLIGKPP